LFFFIKFEQHSERKEENNDTTYEICAKTYVFRSYAVDRDGHNHDMLLES